MEGTRVMDDTEKISQMMIRCGLATGHGGTIDDLIFELEKQIKNTSNAFSDARKQIERLRKALKNVGDALEIAFDYDGDVFRKKHNDATDALIEARKALKENE
jgi:predicted  nucleic acid-binding Zn-ribbon protein